MEQLVTLPASQASAEQRAGRAGRLGPGRALRLWSPAEQQRRPAFDPPALLEADPAPLVLQLAEWGAGLGEELPWLEPPPRPHLLEGQALLRQLEAVDGQGGITPHGKALAGLGVHPRLGHLLLRAQALGAGRLGSELAALLSERDPLQAAGQGCDLLRRIDWLRDAGRDPRRQQLRALQQQLLRLLPASGEAPPPAGEPEASIAAELVALAYPERVALQRPGQPGRYLTRGGRGLQLPDGDPLQGCEALAIATADGAGSDGRIQLALPLPRASLERWAEAEGTQQAEVIWDRQEQRLRCERVLRLGAVVLQRQAWPEAPEPARLAALAQGLQELGLEALPWAAASRSLQQRLCLAHAHLGDPWPDRSDPALLADPLAWLGDQLDGMRTRGDLQQLNLLEALWSGLPWSARQELELLLPPSLAIPSGRQARLDYSSGAPVLAVKLQELFGAATTPTVLQGRLPVTVQLLSPAGRPAAITQDLAGFWAGGYREVRRELRGRYPRHPWPEDPTQAIATALTKRRLQADQSQR
jgi:ATP-dependent helicase HrpB